MSEVVIGNDIISLSSLPRYNRKRYDRFARKILTTTEYASWTQQGSDQVDLYKYWALKEASYKVWNRRSQQRLFNPKWFSIQNLEDVDEVKIEAPALDYTGRVNTHQSYIYAEVVEDDNTSLASIQSVVQNRNIKELGGANIIKENGRPFLKILQKKTPISISHCGDWHAVAFLDR